jgi:hypothetical protein
MKAKTQAKKPRPGEKQRRTTLSLSPALWDDLKAIENETGARPSVIVRRMLEQAIADRKRPAQTSNTQS